MEVRTRIIVGKIAGKSACHDLQIAKAQGGNESLC